MILNLTGLLMALLKVICWAIYYKNCPFHLNIRKRQCSKAMGIPNNKRLSSQQTPYFDHKSINSTCFNTRALHLNRKGTSMVANNISSYINTN